jgi:SAM-dependent MidA family methyltransferase
VSAAARDSVGGGLIDHWSGLSDQRLADFVDRLGLVLDEGQILEVNLDAIEWLRSISRILASGFVVTIDYGDIAPALLSPARREGTLRCFYRHRIVDSPLEGVGERDITSSVNFSALQEYGRDFGLEPVLLESQTSFLMKRGLIERVADLVTRNASEALAAKNLLVPGGIGDYFKVLIQEKRTTLQRQ